MFNLYAGRKKNFKLTQRHHYNILKQAILMENILMENITTYGDETSEINKKN